MDTIQSHRFFNTTWPCNPEDHYMSDTILMNVEALAEAEGEVDCCPDTDDTIDYVYEK